MTELFVGCVMCSARVGVCCLNTYADDLRLCLDFRLDIPSLFPKFQVRCLIVTLVALYLFRLLMVELLVRFLILKLFAGRVMSVCTIATQP